MRATFLLLGLLTMSNQTRADDPAPAPAPPTAVQAAPCTAAEHRQFDFWLGDWEVTGPKGKVVGHSRIESILGSCVISEHWSSATGDGANDGKSYNLYDRDVGKWRQFWVDASGSSLQLSGGLVGADMVLEGVQPNPDPKTGIARRERITWTPNADGSVRQLWQSSTDAGKSWTVAFDGTYRHAAGG